MGLLFLGKSGAGILDMGDDLMFLRLVICAYCDLPFFSVGDGIVKQVVNSLGDL